MTYVVKDQCIKCKYMDCVEVCPVDCFYEGENMLVIHPDECIDCGVCEPECPNTIVKTFNSKLNEKNALKIIKDYEYVVDGSDNFKTKFLVNDTALKLKKHLVVGAISKFDGHLFTYDFKAEKTPCLRCFFQEDKISDDILNCEYEGVLGTVAGILGTLQANEVLKQILSIGQNLNGKILILDLLNLSFRKAKILKQKKCIC